MNPKLLAWAMAVKSRQRWRGRRLPPLWLFTDQRRLADPRQAVAALPKGLCGVVLRHDAEPHRAMLGRDLARLCRQRGNLLAVAGDWKLAWRLRAGLHRREARGGGRCAWSTASAHGIPGLKRAARSECRAAFLSPIFSTASHPGGPSLGPLRWRLLARHGRLPLAALGGVEATRLRRLPRQAVAIGAITALSPDRHGLLGIVAAPADPLAALPAKTA